MTEPGLAGPRLLVPTERQRDVGDEADYRDVAQEDVALQPPPRARHERLIGWARDLDPRTIEGPGLVLLVLCLTSIFARIDEQAIAVLIPQIRADLGVNTTFLGTVAAVLQQGILLTVSLLPLGYLADRVSRVWLVRSGTLLTGVTIGLTGMATNVLGLAGARLSNGVAQAIAQPASFPLMADYFPPRSRARVFSVFFAAAQFGLIVGPVLAGLLGDAIGWRATLLLLGGGAVAVGLLTFLLREPRRGTFDRPDSAAPLPPAPSFGEAYRAAARVATLRRFWYAIPFVGSRGIFSALLLPLFLSEVYQLSSGELGLVFGLNGVSGLVGLLVAGPVGAYLLRDRPGRFMAVLGVAPIVQALVIALVSLRPPLPVAIAILQVFVLAEVIGQPGGYTLISYVVPARVRGLGLQTTVPWQLINLFAMPLLVAAIAGFGMQHGIRLLVPLLVIGGLILVTGAPGVERDMRAARAADAAEVASREADGSTLLVCRDIGVEYDGVQVLFGVDLDIEQGEIVALVGTNGAGKSTLLRAIAGTQQASNGAIFLAGRDITHLPPHETAALGVVTMPGGAAVFPSLTVAENLKAAAWTLHDHPDEVALRTNEVLELFPVLRERLDAPAGSLSGGEQQMVGLSQALLMGPQLLMVDELSLGLAPRIVEQLLDVLRTLNGRGTTIVIVEQSLNVALTIADRAVFMEKGEVRFSGPTEELLRRPDLVRSVFMGGASGGTRSAARKRVHTTEATTAALEVEGIGVRFGGIQALDDVTLSVAPGQVVGVIGPNGAGKTTLFDIVSGFVRPDSGIVRVAGVDVTSAAPDHRARLGLGRSFQNARLFPALTVRENIAVALERRAVKSPVLGALWAPQVRTSERRIGRQVERLVDLMGLAPYADKVLAELSTGSRRAVDVACILALEPSVLLLDEPSSGLAQAETEALAPLLSRIVRETGCGMLVIEHDIPLVMSLSDELVAMESGRVITSGPPDVVRDDPRVLTSYLAASDDVVGRSDNRVSAVAAALLPSKEP